MKINTKVLSTIFRTNKMKLVNFVHICLKKLNFSYIKGLKKRQSLIQILKELKLINRLWLAKGRAKKWHDGWGEALSLYKIKFFDT